MPVPKLEPYLSFNGNCAEAFAFYEKVLGATLEGMTTYGDRMKESCSPCHALTRSRPSTASPAGRCRTSTGAG